jgi:hypothetical protein
MTGNTRSGRDEKGFEASSPATRWSPKTDRSFCQFAGRLDQLASGLAGSINRAAAAA